MLHEVIKKRKSIRQFDGEIIEPDKILSLFEAARRAPSAFNEQPWKFIVAEKINADAFDAVLETLVNKNREWAVNAPLLVIVLAKKILSRNQNSNRHYLYDTASAIANLTFQANSMDLYVHQMGGFDSEKVVEKFSIPGEYEVAVVLAIGRQPVPDNQSNEVEIKLNRLPLENILFEKKFGNVYTTLINKYELTN